MITRRQFFRRLTGGVAAVALVPVLAEGVGIYGASPHITATEVLRRTREMNARMQLCLDRFVEHVCKENFDALERIRFDGMVFGVSAARVDEDGIHHIPLPQVVLR